MKSDIIHVTNGGIGVAEAVRQTEAVASFKLLSKKDSIHLILLTEEMMGMMQALTGEREADFWIEAEESTFTLHLKSDTAMNAEMRKKLLSAATTGANASAKGVIGKLRNLFERMLEPIDGSMQSTYAGMGFTGADIGNMSAAVAGIWSLNRYRSSLKSSNAPKEDWDELERSVIAKIADEIQIGIVDQTVEMTVYKKF